MKTQNEYTLKDAIDLFLTKKNYKKDILPYQVTNAYHQIVGSFISKLTANVNFSNKTLYVLITSAALRNELSYRKDDLITEINKALGEEVLERIILK